MESEHTAKTLQIALGSYDRKELRVEKNYLQEQSPALECTCFQNGGRLLEQLRQGRQFDVVILCSQLEDMSGLEFLMNIRSMDPKPNVVLFDEGRRQNTSAICLESGDGFCYVGHAELKNLLWELYRLPGRQSQRIERKCQELYEGWGIQLPDVNCSYLSCAVGVVYGTSQKLAIRKEILQAVSEQFDVSVSAVDSGIRRMIDQLEAKPSVKWLRFKDESGFDNWFNLNFYTDPANTPISADKGETNKIRVRLVFSIYQNEISETASLLKFYGSTYANSVLGAQHTNFCSGDFMKLDEEGDPELNENEKYFYDPTRWMIYEFDTWVGDKAGAPTRLKIEFPAQGDFTLLVKEVKFMTDVTGDPIQRKYESYTSGPITGISELQKNDEVLYRMDGNNVTFVDNAEVYTISGAKVVEAAANEPVALSKGFYVAKVGQKATKLVIK